MRNFISPLLISISLVTAVLPSTLSSAQGLDGDSFSLTRRGLVDGVGSYVHVLEHFRSASRDVSRTYRDQRNGVLQGKFRNYSDRLNGMSNRFRHEVQMSLVNRVPIGLTINNFNRLSSEMEKLEQEAGRLGPSSPQFIENLEQAIGARLMIMAAVSQQITDTTSGREWLCTAVDRGSEEHAPQHIAIEPDKGSAEASAVAACLEFHGSCRSNGCRPVF